MTSRAWRFGVPSVIAIAAFGVDFAARRTNHSAAGVWPLVAALGLCVTAAAIAFVRWYRSDNRFRDSQNTELALERCVEERTRALRQEVEDRQRAEHLNRGQKRVLEMLADPGDLTTDDILQALVDVVASRNQGWETSIFLVERRGKVMTHAAASGVSDRIKSYLRGVGKDFPDTPECQAALSGERHILEHLSQLELPWSRLLIDSGIFSVWAFPFCTANSGRLAGVFTIYSRSRTGPSQLELETVESAARLAGLVIEHRTIRADLMRTAYEDPVTGLPNRRAGERELEEAIHKTQSAGGVFALFWIDINRFKRINDHYGHPAGNHVLQTLANRLRHHPLVTGTGTVARMSSDEFMVLVPGTFEDLAPFEIARRLTAAIAQPIQFGSTRIDLTASMGVCVCPTDGTSAQALIRNADFAMYRAKASDKGFCLFSAALNNEASEALEIEEGLRSALENGQLHLDYQPIYTIDGQLTSFEALLRFRHPRLGNIPPSRFIPIAEETRQIVTIGNWVLREACRQLREWLDAGLPPVSVSINICALQFARDDFADTVALLLEEYDLEPNRLTIELTESVILSDFPVTLRQMKMLRQCGIHIALDDFGTGYSSLNYLHRIPVDMLKIDRSFIEKITELDGTRPIVEAVLSMARRLGLVVVAEGVETVEQQAILEKNTCDELQGFLFAKPMPAADAARCIEASRTQRFANPLRESDEAAIA